MDWILALISPEAELVEFVPVEVQSMDTSGSYQPEWYRLFARDLPPGRVAKGSNINWENVNKRIIPQLMSKGNVFRREALCLKGLFFVCPEPVYRRLMGRMGTKLSEFPFASGSLNFRYYQLEARTADGVIRNLECRGLQGNVFRREALCLKGLFFVCPEPVYRRLMGRMGTKLSEFPFASGSLNFRYYQLEARTADGVIRNLECRGQFTTTVENLRDAFNSTLGLPPMGVMTEAIKRALARTVARP